MTIAKVMPAWPGKCWRFWSMCLLCTAGVTSIRAQQVVDLDSSKMSPLVCHRSAAAVPLPDVLRETSGLAASLLHDNVFWTHNDRGNPPELFAIDSNGDVLRRIRLEVPATDWEDIEISQCASGSCIFVADTGDNDGERERITIYRLEEPGLESDRLGPIETLHAQFPDGPRDVEALFVLPGTGLFLVSKGRREDIALYRYPLPQQQNAVVALERVRQLFPEPGNGDDRVTAATATSDGRRVGIRTGRSLYVYSVESLLGAGDVDPVVVDLGSLNERQGEGLAMPDLGSIWLSSEADSRDETAVLNRMMCTGATDGSGIVPDFGAESL